tara:strand:+ start:188 stop:619 length:432 start_codon:yes stop_codon:yes gene_type:complete
MVYKDMKNLIMSFVSSGKDTHKYELYMEYYDRLYDYVMDNGYYFRGESYLVGSTMKNILIDNQEEIAFIKKVSRPNLFNYIQFTNNHIETWVRNTMFPGTFQEEFSELFYDNKILDKFLEDIIKIKMFRLNLTFDNNGVIIKK